MSSDSLDRFFEGAGRGRVLDDVLDSTGAVRVEGMSGSGKTRLARKAVSIWRARGHVVDCFNPVIEVVDPATLHSSLRRADIVVIDNVDDLPMASWATLAHAPKRTRLLLLGAPVDNVPLEVDEVFSLAPLATTDVEALLATSAMERSPRWDGSDIAEIVARTSGSLGAILRIVQSGVDARRRPSMPWRHVGLAFGIAFATAGFAWIGTAPEPTPRNIELAPEFDSPSALERYEEAVREDDLLVGESVEDAPETVGEALDLMPDAGRNALPDLDPSPPPVRTEAIVVENEIDTAESPTSRANTPNVPRGPAWLLRRPADDFTIQLFATSSRANVEAFLDAQSDRSPFAVFEQIQGGIRIHVVAYGSFSSRAAAATAALELPETVGDVAPWIRDFAGIQRAIGAQNDR